ncbi:MAG: CHASE2 domain-containing protein [Bacteroidetes bacterium]|nr:CHASE2 domain-containing protein [Bacteroidota bacterium]
MKQKTKLLIKDSFLATLFSFILIFILSFLFINLSFFKPLKETLKDFSFLDVYYSENFNPSNTVNNDIILINIEQRDRFEIAQLLDAVKNEQPKVIGLDIIFKEQKEPFIDSILINSLQASNIVTAFLIKKDSVIANNSVFNTSSASGFINLNFNDKTNVIREFASVKNLGDTSYTSFTSQIVRSYSASNWEEYNYDQKLSKEKVIKFYGNYDTFLTFGFDEFMQNNNKELIKDKIVLLGYLGTPTGNINDVEDKHFTPLNKATAGKSNPDMFGIVVHANIINMMIKNEFMYSVSTIWIGIITFLFTFFGIMFFIWFEERDLIYFYALKKIFLFLFTIILMWLSLWLFKKGVILKTAPIIGITLAACSFIAYYKYVFKYIQKKTKWKSYFQ